MLYLWHKFLKMEIHNFAFLLTLAAIVAILLGVGLNKRLTIFGSVKYMFPAIAFSAAILIMIDLQFAKLAVWSYHPKYVLGINLLDLPVEEWLFFLVVPFLGIFIYELVKQQFRHIEYPNFFLLLSLIVLVLVGVTAYSSHNKIYPFFLFFLITIYLGYTIFRNRFKTHYTKFYLSYIILLVPFILIEKVLIGLPIIEYNDVYFLGVQLFSIPVENFASLFLLHIIAITVYEYLKERRIY